MCVAWKGGVGERWRKDVTELYRPVTRENEKYPEVKLKKKKKEKKKKREDKAEREKNTSHNTDNPKKKTFFPLVVKAVAARASLFLSLSLYFFFGVK